MSFLGGLLTTIGKSALPLIAEYGVYKLAQAGSSLIDTIGNYISGRTNRTIGNTSSRSKTLGAMHSNIINRFTTTRPDRVNPFSGNFVEPRYEPSDF